ncbi:DUF418 domain-containing protein [Flavisolibacter sp. BT320]|nr:DUF418 domain-containing protein [Flavisolibacter longurius]
MNENSPATPSPPPPALHSRISSLDVLRGLAILGAILVTIWTFGGFSEQQQNAALLQKKGSQHTVYTLMQFLFDGKMLALISLVFGASMVIFLSKEPELGRQPAGDIFIKRQLWLILFGIVNAVLFLYPMDFLFHLGIVGLLLFPLVRISQKALLIVALATTFIYCGKFYWDYSDDKKAYRKYVAVTTLEKKYEKDSIAKAKGGIVAKRDTLTKQQKGEKEAWTGLLASKKVDIKKDEGAIKAMRNTSYGKVWNHLLPQTQGREAAWTYQKGIWDVSAMMLLGMLLYKIGFFNQRFRTRRYALVALIAIVGAALLGWFRLHFQVQSLTDYEKYVSRQLLPPTFFYPIERAAMALGYASLVMVLLSVRVVSKVLYAAEAVGKMALTNYLAQTLFCTWLFYGYGLGHYGRFGQYNLYFIAAEIILVQCVFSVIWLRYYNYGPAEWLLRRLSAGKWLPASLRKPQTEPIIPALP